MDKFASVVILNFNGKRFLKDCLSSCLKQDYKEYEVILVDNNSQDGSVDFVKKEFAGAIKTGKLKVIPHIKNDGFAEGNNVGVRVADKRSEYIVLLNNDTEVPKNWLKEIVLPLKKDKKIGISGSLVYDQIDDFENGMSYEKYLNYQLYEKRRYTTINFFGQHIYSYLTENELKKGIFDTFYVGGCALAYRKEMIKEPFLEPYFAYAEDVYLGWYSRFRGFKNITTAKSTVIHYSGQTKNSSKTFSKFALFHGNKNQIINYLLFYKKYYLITLFPLFITNQIMTLLYQPRTIPQKLKAYMWVITHLMTIYKERKRIIPKKKIQDKDVVKHMSYKFYDLSRVPFWSKPILGLLNCFSYLWCSLFFIPFREKSLKKR